jgi:hypothetical protein
MSLKFGIYLVEQRIISPEQFCGLVKIQQETTMSLATIAVRKNLLTIKQVARILTLLELEPTRHFVEIAREEKLLDQTDGERLIHEHLSSSPPIRKLVVECGLLTAHQTEVLYHHFEKQMAIGLKSQLPNRDSGINSQPPNVASQPVLPAGEAPFSPPQPKFTQRSHTGKKFAGQPSP